MSEQLFPAPPAHLNILSDNGGLGDQIARLPAIRHVHRNYEHVSMTVYWHDYFLELAEFLLPCDERLTHKKLSQKPKDLARPIIDFSPERLTTLGLHLTTHAFLILTDRLPPTDEDMWYPQALSLTERRRRPYVVFTAAFTSETREWPGVFINDLARRLRASCYVPVLLGNIDDIDAGEGFIKSKYPPDLDRSLFKDYTNKTTLLQALGIMQAARAVVGVDNGLLHLAHCTDVPVVAGYTSVEAKHRVPKRPKGTTEVIEANVPFYGRQSRSTYTNADFRIPTWQDHACSLTMRSDRYIEALLRIGLSLP